MSVPLQLQMLPTEMLPLNLNQQLENGRRIRRAPCKVGAFPAGAKPARPLSLRPEAIGAVMEVTKWLKPSV